MRQPPILTRPITNGHSEFLRNFLENIRHHIAKSQTEGKSGISHRIGGQHKQNCESKESAAQQESRSSDSSDES